MKRSGETLAILTPTILAYGVAAWCLAALTWDGAGYVFNTLQSGAPVISHHRFTNWPSLAAVAAAGSLTDNARALGVLYGGLVSLTPLLSLALGLHFLREPRLRPLRSWLVLGILWGALPGEICLMSEASLAVQVFWAILAFVAAGMPASAVAWMLLLIPWLFFLHPTAAVMFGIAAILCFGMGWKTRNRRSALWGVAFAVLAAMRAGFSAATITPYERAEFGFQPNWDAFLGSIWGWPIGLLIFLYLFAATGLLDTMRPGGAKIRRFGLVSAAAFLAVGLWWAADSTLWAGAIGYRRFVLVCALPLVAMAVVHWTAIRLGNASALPPTTAVLVAVIFAAIYIVQCLAWRADVRRFEGTLVTSDAPFITLESDPWMKRRALDHWGSSMLSAILQGPHPRVLYAETVAHIKGGDIELFPGGWLRMEDGWFHLQSHTAEKSAH